MDETTAFANLFDNKDVSVQSQQIRRIRALFMLINTLFGLFGLLVTLFSLYILTDEQFWTIANQTQQIHRLILLDIRVWIVLLFLGGILAMILSIVGIIGKPSVLRFYCILLSVLFIVYLIAFSSTLVYQSELDKIYQTDLSRTVKEATKTQNTVILDAFHRLESDLNCTDVDDPEDHKITAASIGCSPIILNYLRHRVYLVVLSVLGFSVFELFAMVIGLLVIRAIRENPDYHYMTNFNGILSTLIPKYK